MSTSIAAVNVPVDLAVNDARLPTLFMSDAARTGRCCEFFAANIRNKNTRRAFANPSTSGRARSRKAAMSAAQLLRWPWERNLTPTSAGMQAAIGAKWMNMTGKPTNML